MEHPRIAEQRERERLAAEQPGTVSAGCPNPWHVSAPARLREACPECPGDPDPDDDDPDDHELGCTCIFCTPGA